ncbi:hypothetical protein [Pseudomonas putida]|uniref:hypothetical protein n=1 Tax=Pseudomonas putida TaxID=303 RepID=UPI000DFC46EF|nr:hypothetical protein [Pseudomonas putida]SUD77836.1 Uncharacterised protein [Pseudomonas putida]SUF22581.1 Uncharacterised protein [Pseudomonas putida]
MRDIDRAAEVGWDAESAERRAKNRQSSAEVLAQHGVQFEPKNLDAHLIVSHAGKVVDFWPGTGKYIPRDGGRPGRGVFNLLKLLGVKL